MTVSLVLALVVVLELVQDDAGNTVARLYGEVLVGVAGAVVPPLRELQAFTQKYRSPISGCERMIGSAPTSTHAIE